MKQHPVMSKKDRLELTQYGFTAYTTNVRAHTRKVKTSFHPRYRHLKKWAKLEASIFKLAAETERNGLQVGDQSRALRAIEFLSDTFVK